jgi:hypothetical protein
MNFTIIAKLNPLPPQSDCVLVFNKNTQNGSVKIFVKMIGVQRPIRIFLRFQFFVYVSRRIQIFVFLQNEEMQQFF